MSTKQFIKGYTNFGNESTYKFIILNNVICFKYLENNKEITHPTINFDFFVNKYNINYVSNMHRSVLNYHIYGEKCSRQIIKNELKSKRFQEAFENKLI